MLYEVITLLVVLRWWIQGQNHAVMGVTAVEAINKVHREVRAVLTLPDTSFYAEKKFKIFV